MDIRVCDRPAAWAASSIARRLGDACRRRGHASLALSGGATGAALVGELSGLALPWAAITVWQVDERVAPDGDHDRNVAQLADLPCRVRAMPVTATDLRAAAARYAGGLPERFDVVHLGVGIDGHTASWPPGNTVLLASARSVELTPEFHGRRRMTLTPGPVNTARSRVVLATGASKRATIERWLLDVSSLPISAVRRGSTTVFLDRAAAPGV